MCLIKIPVSSTPFRYPGASTESGHALTQLARPWVILILSASPRSRCPLPHRYWTMPGTEGYAGEMGLWRSNEGKCRRWTSRTLDGLVQEEGSRRPSVVWMFSLASVQAKSNHNESESHPILLSLGLKCTGIILPTLPVRGKQRQPRHWEDQAVVPKSQRADAVHENRLRAKNRRRRRSECWFLLQWDLRAGLRVPRRRCCDESGDWRKNIELWCLKLPLQKNAKLWGKLD